MEMISIRASSLSDLCDCPARWEAKFINGMRLPGSSAAWLGTSIHAGTAAYDQSTIDGNQISIDDAAGVVVDTLYHPREDINWEDTSPEKLEGTATGLLGLYCNQIAPIQKYVAIEATCEALEIEDLGIKLTGTTDRIRETETGEYGIADIKTGGSVVATDGTVKTGSHAAQIAVYELLAENSSGLPMTAEAQIIGLQTAKTARGQRAGIGIIQNAKEILLGSEEQAGLLEIVSKILHTGLFYGNPRSSLCSPKYCPNYTTCRFKR